MNTKQITWKTIIYAIEPALLYTVLSNVIYLLLQLLAAGRQVSGLLLQMITSAVCLAVFGWRAHREKISIWGKQRTVYRYPASFCYVSAVVMWGIACNQIIFLSRLKEISDGYRHVTQVFYGNSLWLEILALCILGPVLEELVYRGFVYRRFCQVGSQAVAAIGSSVIFGLLHFNFVQCIYAFAVGLLLAYIIIKTGSLAVAVAAHMIMNLVSVLWTETSWLDFLNQDGMALYFLTAVCLALTAVFLSDGNRLIKKG